MSDNFSFRWGVDVFDNARTEIPNWILEYYYLVPVSNTEMMFIIHLASFKYESSKGRAMPSLTGSIRKRMGYKSNQGVINVEQGLIDRGLLIVHKSPGVRSEYDFTPFSKAILEIARNPSTKLDESGAKNEPKNPSTKLDESKEKSKKPSTKLDGSRQQKLTQRIKEEDSKNKNFKIDSSLNSDQILDTLFAFFLSESKLPAPGSLPIKQAWEDDLLEIYKQAGDLSQAQKLITEAIGRIDELKYTMSGPGSLLNICRTEAARLKRQAEPEKQPPPLPPTPAALIPPPTPLKLTKIQQVEQEWKDMLMRQMTRQTYDNLFRDASLSKPNGKYQIAAKSEEAKDWIEGRMMKTIKIALSTIVQKPVEIVVVVEGGGA